jgi:hypothetical protein
MGERTYTQSEVAELMIETGGWLRKQLDELEAVVRANLEST